MKVGDLVKYNAHARNKTPLSQYDNLEHGVVGVVTYIEENGVYINRNMIKVFINGTLLWYDEPAFEVINVDKK